MTYEEKTIADLQKIINTIISNRNLGLHLYVDKKYTGLIQVALESYLKEFQGR